MNKVVIIVVIGLLTRSLLTEVFASDDHNHQQHENHSSQAGDHKHQQHADHQEHGHTEIDSDTAKRAGIKSAYAGPQLLRQGVRCFGRLTLGPEHTSHVRARFPGVITSVEVNLGDRVNSGDLLAVVESNQSLKKYQLRASIAGTVTQRHANIGDTTQQRVLFSIAKMDALWAELRVFPEQQKVVAVNQSVNVAIGGRYYQTTIAHLIPAPHGKPYVIARAQLKGPIAAMYPGLMVEAKVATHEWPVQVAVKNNALHSLHNQIGVFVKNKNQYEFVPLELGLKGDQFTEVVSGLPANTEYVAGNSYLVKADIQKSEAAHEH